MKVGAEVVPRSRRTAFDSSVDAEVGTVIGLVEPTPGWHRALVKWPDRTEQFVDVDKLVEVVKAQPPPLAVSKQRCLCGFFHSVDERCGPW